jgi:hypothetical protein
VAFAAGGPTNVLVETGGRITLGAGSTERGHLGGTVVVMAGGSLAGFGRITRVQMAGTLQGRLEFGSLTLAPGAASRFELSSRPDRWLMDAPVELAGRLELQPLPLVSPTQFFAPQPDEEFVLVETIVAGGLTGAFSNAPFGQRVQVPGGAGGSFLLTRSADGRQAVLSRYLPSAEYIQYAPLKFLLPEIAGRRGGCFLVPHAAISLPEGSWAGGRLRIEFTQGFDPALDELRFQPNPAFPEADALTFSGQAGGEQTVSYRGVAFGTAQLTPGLLICALNAQADAGAVVALLGRLHYANSELNTHWYTTANRIYPERRLLLTLTDAAGMVWEFPRPVEFPRLTRLQLPESLELPGGQSTVLVLHGAFSSGQVLPVPKLVVTWNQDCSRGGVLDGVPAPESPGNQPVKGPSLGMPPLDMGDYCCKVSARETNSALSATTIVYKGSVRTLPIEDLHPALQFILAISGRYDDLDELGCPADHVLFNTYRIPDCPSDPGSGEARKSAETPAPVAALPTYHALETFLKDTAPGRRLAALYRQHSPEVVVLFLRNTRLAAQAQELLLAFQPGVAALIAGRGDDFTITPAMLARLNEFWNGLAAAAGPELRAALAEERGRFGYALTFHGLQGFGVFQDVDFNRWAGLLGLAPTTRPRFQASAYGRTATGFQLAGNDLPGREPTLWRSGDLRTWSQVPLATFQREAGVILFTDPAPPETAAFYEARW